MIRPGAIGDCILSLPALEYLKAGYTEVWISSPVVPLIQFADAVRAIASTGLDLVFDSVPEPLGETLRGFDEIVSWYGTNRPEFRQAMNAVHPRCTFLDALPPVDWRESAADFFLKPVGAQPGLRPRIALARGDVRNTLVIHPFSGSAAKNWPLERFRDLAARLPAKVEWTAGPEEHLQEAQRFGHLLELAVWMRGAAAYLGNDSGISHLAAAIGVPSIVLFGPTDPVVWAPRGKNVQVLRRQPIHELPVEEVLEAVEGQLSRLPDLP